MAIAVKSAREAASLEDGSRVLVERNLPTGLSRESLGLRLWLPELAPSSELAMWFAQHPGQWLHFRRRYLAELGSEGAITALEGLEALADSEASITLIVLDNEPEQSHGAILRDLLSGVRKPPSSTGPVRAASAGRKRAVRKRP